MVSFAENSRYQASCRRELQSLDFINLLNLCKMQNFVKAVNSLSHYTYFFPFHLRFFFCSCCLFICLFVCLKVYLVIEKKHLMDWPPSPLSHLHLGFKIVLMGWPFRPKRIIKSPSLPNPEFENNTPALLTRLHRKSRVSRLRPAITYLLLNACQIVPFSYNPHEADLT